MIPTMRAAMLVPTPSGVSVEMNLDLIPADLKVLIALLHKAGDEFGNHGCNDFHLVKDAGLTPGEAEALKSRMQAGASGDEARAYDRDYQYDWLLFRRYEQVFKAALESVNPPPAVPLTCQRCGEQFLPAMAKFHGCVTEH